MREIVFVVLWTVVSTTVWLSRPMSGVPDLRMCEALGVDCAAMAAEDDE